MASYTIAEYAKKIGISRRAIETRIKNGQELPGVIAHDNASYKYHVGRRMLVVDESLLELKENTELYRMKRKKMFNMKSRGYTRNQLIKIFGLEFIQKNLPVSQK